MELVIEFSVDLHEPESTVLFVKATGSEGIEHDIDELHYASVLHVFKTHLSQISSVS